MMDGAFALNSFTKAEKASRADYLGAIEYLTRSLGKAIGCNFDPDPDPFIADESVSPGFCCDIRASILSSQIVPIEISVRLGMQFQESSSRPIVNALVFVKIRGESFSCQGKDYLRLEYLHESDVWKNHGWIHDEYGEFE